MMTCDSDDDFGFPFLEKLYPYQKEIYEKSLNEDTIVFLPTGAGKTVIAAALANRMALKYSSKRVVFVVQRVPLVRQQCIALTRALGESCVETVSGPKRTVDSWGVFMDQTHSKALVIIDTIFYKWCTECPKAITFDTSLIILDEIHNALGGPYKQLIELVHRLAPRRLGAEKMNLPQIIGLTASPVLAFNQHDSLKELLDITRCRIVFVESEKESLREKVPVPVTISLEYFPSPPESSFEVYIRSIIKVIHEDSKVIVNTLLRKLHECPPGTLAYGNKCEQLRLAALQKGNLPSFIFARAVATFLLHASNSLIIMESQSVTEAFNTVMHKDVFDCLKPAESSEAAQFLLPIYMELEKFMNKLCAHFAPKKNLSASHVSHSLNASSRMRFLIHTLELIGEEVEKRKANFNGIVFCDTRCSVYRIVDELRKSPKMHQLYKPEAFVGKGRVIYGDEERHMTDPQQRKVLEQFRNGQTRLLVATSVAEEGLDIATCNVVIRFDSCMTLRSFIQSRGRARHRNALFIVFEHARRELKVSEAAPKAVALQEHLVRKESSAQSREIPSMREPWESSPSWWISRFEDRTNVRVLMKEIDRRHTLPNGGWLCELSVKLPNSPLPGAKENEITTFVSTFTGIGSQVNARRAAQVELCRKLSESGFFSDESGRIDPRTRMPLRFLSSGLCICQSSSLSAGDVRREYAPNAEVVKTYSKNEWKGDLPSQLLMSEAQRRRIPRPQITALNASDKYGISITVSRRCLAEQWEKHDFVKFGPDALESASIEALDYLGVLCLKNVPERVEQLVAQALERESKAKIWT